MIPTSSPWKNRRMIKRQEKHMMLAVDNLPSPLHNLAIKLLVGPFVKANAAHKQTLYTRAVRAIWRSL